MFWASAPDAKTDRGMKIFALGDPHLSFGRPKPMDIFGDFWKDHHQSIAAAWDRTIQPPDVVLIPGDISWAHNAQEAKKDLEFLAARPGRLKVLLRGNHDSWWAGPSKMKAILPAGFVALHQDALRLEEGVVLCGARGWNLPGMPWGDPERDPALFQRELVRLDLSLAKAAALRRDGDFLLALLHYPPLGPGDQDSPVLQRLAQAGVRLAVYGHLHGEDHAWAPQGRYSGIELKFVAADFLNFCPALVFESAGP